MSSCRSQVIVKEGNAQGKSYPYDRFKGVDTDHRTQLEPSPFEHSVHSMPELIFRLPTTYVPKFQRVLVHDMDGITGDALRLREIFLIDWKEEDLDCKFFNLMIQVDCIY